MTQHTPGPWERHDKYENETGEPVIEIHPVGDEMGDQIIADVLGMDAEGAQESNARLIAAAPDLLAALRAIYADTQGLRHFDTEAGCAILDKARAAIASATGEK